MMFNLLGIWKFKGYSFGFSVLEIERDNEDENNYALVGFSYFKEDRLLQVDLLWHLFEFKIGKQNNP